MEKIITTTRGRKITEKDIGVIKNIIKDNYSKGRSYIYKKLCIYWDWYQPNGNLKEVAAGEILRKLQKLNLIMLPPPKIISKKKKEEIKQLNLDLYPTLEGGLSNFRKEITLKLVSKKEASFWNRLIREYHYQGYSRIVGKHLKYIA